MESRRLGRRTDRLTSRILHQRRRNPVAPSYPAVTCRTRVANSNSKVALYIQRGPVTACTQRLLPIAGQSLLSTPLSVYNTSYSAHHTYYLDYVSYAQSSYSALRRQPRRLRILLGRASSRQSIPVLLCTSLHRARILGVRGQRWRQPSYLHASVHQLVHAGRLCSRVDTVRSLQTLTCPPVWASLPGGKAGY